MDKVVDLSSLVSSDRQSFDLAIARSLQDVYDKEAAQRSSPSQTRPRDTANTIRTHSAEGKGNLSIVDKNLEMVDPNPNIHQLFVEFDQMFFWGTLTSTGVAVDWSARMTL